MTGRGGGVAGSRWQRGSRLADLDALRVCLVSAAAERRGDDTLAKQMLRAVGRTPAVIRADG